MESSVCDTMPSTNQCECCNSLEFLKDNPIYCLVPNQCREGLKLTLDTPISDINILYKSIEKAIEGAYDDDIKILIMGIISTNNNLNHDITFMKLPKELVNQFENAGIMSVALYISNSTNPHEYNIIDKSPNLNMVSAHDNNGDPKPFCARLCLS
tara:strand:- start:227 stop:691 length:465 start_codon:yes stop_codon:yes gene_type:complete